MTTLLNQLAKNLHIYSSKYHDPIGSHIVINTLSICRVYNNYNESLWEGGTRWHFCVPKNDMIYQSAIRPDPLNCFQQNSLNRSGA